MSLRQTAKQLGISPAYLSYMVNGKRPWRPDLYERYSQLVNTSVNSRAQSVNNIPRNSGHDSRRIAQSCGAIGANFHISNMVGLIGR